MSDKNSKKSKDSDSKNTKENVEDKDSVKTKETNTSSQDSKKKMHNKTLGQKGEEAACAYLKNKGYEIVAKNWKCRVGEADIIAIIDDVLVFVEVKTRSNLDRGLPEDAITPVKRNKYERIAAMYLRQSNFVDMSIRFDVIAILTVSKDKAMLRHHINAFGVA